MFRKEAHLIVSFLGTSLVTSNAGSATFMVPLAQIARIPELFAFLATNEGKSLVKDWGLSHTCMC